MVYLSEMVFSLSINEGCGFFTVNVSILVFI